MKVPKFFVCISFFIITILANLNVTAQQNDQFKFAPEKQMLGSADILIDGALRKNFNLQMTQAPVAENFGGYYYLATNFPEDDKSPYNPYNSAVRLGIINLGHHAAADAADSTAGQPNMAVASFHYTSSAPACAVVTHPQTKNDALVTFSIEIKTNLVKYFIIKDPGKALITETGTLKIDPKYGNFTQITACGIGSGRICIVGRCKDGRMVCLLYQYVMINNKPTFDEITFLSNYIINDDNFVETASDKKLSVVNLNTEYKSVKSFSIMIAWLGTDKDQSINVSHLTEGYGLTITGDKLLTKDVSIPNSQSGIPISITLYKKNADPNDKEMEIFWPAIEYQETRSHMGQFAYDDASSFQNFPLSIYTGEAAAAYPMGVNGDGIAIIYSRPIYNSGTYPFMVKGRKYNFKNWQGTFLKDELTLNDISLPGSHNAGMNEEQKWDISNFMLSNGACNNCNAITQTYRVGTQLNYGFRYIDAKITIHGASTLTNYRLCGSPDFCYGELFEEELNEIKDFLIKNPTEFLILNVQPSDIGTGTAAADLINDKLKGLIYQANSNANSLDDIINTPISFLKGKVIIISPDDNFKNKTQGCLKDIFEVSQNNAHRSYFSSNDNL
ncbi:MAG: hypothetical protein ABI266_00945, partial [Ginsengibacter sp.]